MKLPKNINDWETTEEWENIWVSQRRYENIYNEAVDYANDGDVKGFIKTMTSLADVKELDKDDLYALPEDPKHEYEEGVGPNGKSLPNIKKDYKKALKWYSYAAKQGSDLAKKDGLKVYNMIRS